MLAEPDQIRESTQRGRLDDLLGRCVELPVYRSLLARTGGAPAALEQFPFITKRDMRENFPGNFLRSGQTLETLLENNAVELEYTSGTSEERVPVVFRRGWWDEQEERVLRLNRFVARVLDEPLAVRRATITTPACNGRSCPTVWQSAAQRTIGATRFLNLARIPFVLSDAELARMAEEITEWSPRFLDVSPVHAVWFALYCERLGLRFPSLRFILCSYEFASVVHRRILRRVFGVPVFNLYGSTETGHLLMENERGEMLPNHENALLEVLSKDERGAGDLVVTTLTNDYMPLVRYRIGDLVERRGVAGAETYVVHGRTGDTLRSRDGRRVTTWQVDECFADIAGMAHYQLRQAENGGCLLRYVPEGNGPGVEELKRLVSRLESLFQVSGKIVTKAVDLLLPTPSGKFRLTYRR
jgi:phenylacetate-CoA ligase